MADIMNPPQNQPQYAASEATTDRDDAQVKADNELAERLSRIIEDGPSIFLAVFHFIRTDRSYRQPTSVSSPSSR